MLHDIGLPFTKTLYIDFPPFFSNQSKEIEEKNRMGKTRDLFKKIGDTKGISDARMSMMRGSNDAEEFKKR